MKRWLFSALLFAAFVSAASAFSGGSFAAPLAGMAFPLPFSNDSAVTKVQTACGWTYACTNIGNGANAPQNVQIYGPVNIYTNPDDKPDVWKVPEGAWPWNGDQTDQSGWHGWGCSGHVCDEKCGAFCWFQRIRNGYCGHGCDAYREHVMFQPIRGNLRPFVYRDPPDGDYGYGQGGGYGGYSGGNGGYYGNGGGQQPYGYGRGGAGGGYGYSKTSWGEGRYYSSGQRGYESGRRGYEGSPNAGYVPPPAGSRHAPQPAYGGPGPAPSGERFVDRLRRFFVGRQDYRDDANGPVRFERPAKELVPLRRFDGPKYPPSCTGKNC